MSICLENHLVIFIKYPQKGFVKTRLARDIGAEKSTFLYKKFVEIILRQTKSKFYSRSVFYTPENKREQITEWLGEGLCYYLQEGNDLGCRLYNAFDKILRLGSKRVVVIGSDNPLIDEKVVLKSFKELIKKECVVGPSLDGGYYLLGLRLLIKDIFENIDWSTNKVLGQTSDILDKLKVTYKLLDTGLDVDRKKDLVLLRDKLNIIKYRKKEFRSLLSEVEKVLNIS